MRSSRTARREDARRDTLVTNFNGINKGAMQRRQGAGKHGASKNEDCLSQAVGHQTGSGFGKRYHRLSFRNNSRHQQT